MIFVYREEREGPAGLKKIKDRTNTTYTLTVDLDKAETEAYSPKKMTFDNYVIDSTGRVRAIVPGTLRTRATAAQLLQHLKDIQPR